MNKIWAAMLISLATLMAVPLAHAEGEVARSIITTGVADREPINDLEVIPASNDTVFFFTDLRGMKGQTVVHRWMHGAEQMADVSFNVGGPRWRVWSSKKMQPEWTGSWTVQVVDSMGQVLAEKSFTYGMAEDAATGTKAEEKPMVEKPATEEAQATEQAPEQAPESGTTTPAPEQNGTDTAK